MNIAKLSRTSILKNICKWLLLLERSWKKDKLIHGPNCGFTLKREMAIHISVNSTTPLFRENFHENSWDETYLFNLKFYWMKLNWSFTEIKAAEELARQLIFTKFWQQWYYRLWRLAPFDFIDWFIKEEK